jgi:hypothetical protein
VRFGERGEGASLRLRPPKGLRGRGLRCASPAQEEGRETPAGPRGRTGRRSGVGLQWCANVSHSGIRTGAIAQVFPTLARKTCKGLRSLPKGRPKGRTLSNQGIRPFGPVFQYFSCLWPCVSVVRNGRWFPAILSPLNSLRKHGRSEPDLSHDRKTETPAVTHIRFSKSGARSGLFPVVG